MEPITQNISAMIAFVILIVVSAFIIAILSRKSTDKDFKIALLEETLGMMATDLNKKTKANIYLRGKIDIAKQEYAKLENQFNYYKKNDWEYLYRLVDEKLQKERNRVKELEALIANKSIPKDKKIKPLDVALNEMNQTADKQKKSHYDTLLKESKDMYRDVKHTTLAQTYPEYFGGDQEAPKNLAINTNKNPLNYKYKVRNKKGITRTLSYFELNAEMNREGELVLVDMWYKDSNPDSDEDQYNTTAEDNEDNIGDPHDYVDKNPSTPFGTVKDCSCNMCNERRKSYQEWRTKQKNGHRKDSNEA